MSSDNYSLDRHGFRADGSDLDYGSGYDDEEYGVRKALADIEQECIAETRLVEEKTAEAKDEETLEDIIFEAEFNGKVTIDLEKLKDENLTRLKKEKVRNDIVSIVAGLHSNSMIQNKAIKKLFFINLEYMINVYSKQESLPYYYVELAKERNCLEILIKEFLKKDVGYILTLDLIKDIDTLIEDIYLNKDIEIIYTLVGKIQKFIHTYTDEKNGKNASKQLNITNMRNLLATARLHLNIEIIKYKDKESIIYMIEESEKASIIERYIPSTTLSSFGIKYINKKKVRDLKTLVDFGYFNIASKIYDISQLDKNKPVEEFKNLIINVYCDSRYRKELNKPRWIGEIDT